MDGVDLPTTSHCELSSSRFQTGKTSLNALLRYAKLSASNTRSLRDRENAIEVIPYALKGKYENRFGVATAPKKTNT